MRRRNAAVLWRRIRATLQCLAPVEPAPAIGAETCEIAFVAKHPGDRALHCHMLTHAGAGTMARFRVLG